MNFDHIFYLTQCTQNTVISTSTQYKHGYQDLGVVVCSFCTRASKSNVHFTVRAHLSLEQPPFKCSAPHAAAGAAQGQQKSSSGDHGKKAQSSGNAPRGVWGWRCQACFPLTLLPRPPPSSRGHWAPSRSHVSDQTLTPRYPPPPDPAQYLT